MTQLEKQIVSLLAMTRMLPGSFDKRFIKNLAAKNSDIRTDKGRNYLLHLLKKYRKQMGAPWEPLYDEYNYHILQEPIKQGNNEKQSKTTERGRPTSSRT